MIDLVSAAKLAPALGPWFGLAALLAVLLKAWQPFREMALKRDETVEARLSARVEMLEKLLATETRRLEDKLEAERARHTAEMQIMRHRLNNETQSLNALLLLLESNPARVTESIAAIKEMRAKAELALAAERGAITGERVRTTKAASLDGDSA